MIRGSRWLRIHLVLGSAALAARPAAATVPTLADVVGHYEGAWSNTTYGSTAPAHIRIVAKGPLATLGVDLDSGPNGSVFGLGFDPPEVELQAPLGSQAIDKPGDSLFGNVSCSGNPTSFTCNGNLINAYVVSGSISGSVANGVLASNYTLNLANTQVAVGTLNATRVPEPASGLGVSALATLAALARRRDARGAR